MFDVLAYLATEAVIAIAAHGVVAVAPPVAEGMRKVGGVGYVSAEQCQQMRDEAQFIATFISDPDFVSVPGEKPATRLVELHGKITKDCK